MVGCGGGVDVLVGAGVEVGVDVLVAVAVLVAVDVEVLVAVDVVVAVVVLVAVAVSGGAVSTAGGLGTGTTCALTRLSEVHAGASSDIASSTLKATTSHEGKRRPARVAAGHD